MVTVESLAVQLQNHLDDCYKVRLETNQTLGTLSTQLGAAAKKLDDFEKLPMKAVRWIASIVVVAAITTVVSNYLNTQAATEKAQQAATAAQASQATVVAAQQQTNTKLNAIIAKQGGAGP